MFQPKLGSNIWRAWAAWKNRHLEDPGHCLTWSEGLEITLSAFGEGHYAEQTHVWDIHAAPFVICSARDCTYSRTNYILFSILKTVITVIVFSCWALLAKYPNWRAITKSHNLFWWVYLSREWKSQQATHESLKNEKFSWGKDRS